MCSRPWIKLKILINSLKVYIFVVLLTFPLNPQLTQLVNIFCEPGWRNCHKPTRLLHILTVLYRCVTWLADTTNLPPQSNTYKWSPILGSLRTIKTNRADKFPTPLSPFFPSFILTSSIPARASYPERERREFYTISVLPVSTSLSQKNFQCLGVCVPVVDVEVHLMFSEIWLPVVN